MTLPAMRCSGTGPAVVFVHGVGLDCGMWDGVFARLEPNFTCVAFDMPGHGATPLPPGEVTLATYVDALSAVVAETAGCAVVGFSMGAMVAQAFAAGDPPALSKLVLMNSVYRRDAAQREAIMNRVATAEREGPGALIDGAVARWFTPAAQETQPEIVAEVRHRLETNDPAGFLAAYRVFAEADAGLAATVSRIGCPTLVMTAELDANSTPAMTRALAEALPSARAEVLPGLAHGAPIEDPKRVAAVLEAFLMDGVPQ